MNIINVAVDVLRELLARKFILAAFVFIAFGMLVLTLALDLDVVDGGISAVKVLGLGGELDKGAGFSASDALAIVLKPLTYMFFYMSLAAGIVATSDIAAKMLSPGRVELYLSLPVRRVELVVGTYVGVLFIATVATTFTVGGVSLILFFKLETLSWAPIAGAAAAVLGFAAVYALMLLMTCWVRSGALAAASGMMVFIMSAVTSNRETFLSLFSGWFADVLGVLIAPLPRLHTLAKLGANLQQVNSSKVEAAKEALTFVQAEWMSAVFGCVLFAAACVAAASYVVNSKDY